MRRKQQMNDDDPGTPSTSCSRCGYDTRACAVGEPCPECGHPVTGFVFPGRWERMEARRMFGHGWRWAAAAGASWVFGCVGFPLALVAFGTIYAPIVGFLSLFLFIAHFVLGGLALGHLLGGAPGTGLPRFGLAVGVLYPVLGLSGLALASLPVGGLGVLSTPAIAAALALATVGLLALVDAGRRPGFRAVGIVARSVGGLAVVVAASGAVLLSNAPIAEQGLVAGAFIGGTAVLWFLIAAIARRLAREIRSKG